MHSQGEESSLTLESLPEPSVQTPFFRGPERSNLEYLARAAELREKMASAAFIDEQRRVQNLEGRLRELTAACEAKTSELTAMKADRERIDATIKETKAAVFSRNGEIRRAEDLLRDLNMQAQLVGLKWG